MTSFRLVLAQINPTVGALARNADLILEAAREAAERSPDLVVFPELALSGYPPEDLVMKPHFIEDCERQLERLARELPGGMLVAVGSPVRGEELPHNAAVVFHGGRIAAIYRKVLLPNYGVFDEKRVFAPGAEALVLQAGRVRIGVHICEDSWVARAAPVQDLKEARPHLIVNLSASPYHRGKLATRTERLHRAAAEIGAPLGYCNLVGGQDELVFDGASLVVQPDGRLAARARQFAPALCAVDLELGERPAPADAGPARLVECVPAAAAGRPALEAAALAEPLDDLAEVYAALRCGLHDYVEKNGFRKVLVAISGGIDSALVATLAVDALGADRVVGATMPSAFSSEGTLGDAGRLAENLGIAFHTLPIRALYEHYLEELAGFWEDRPADVTEENLQARIRGNLIMALSNKFGWLVLTTGNKSELATGYCTLYGDMAGGFAVIKDVPKTLVFALSRWRNAQGAVPVIPPSTIERPPSAELRPGQKDTDSLPPYEILDAILQQYVEQDRDVEQIAAAGFEPAVVNRVARLVDLSEYKRRQGAPGVKITPKAFGRDRRMPITNRYRDRIQEEPSP